MTPQARICVEEPRAGRLLVCTMCAGNVVGRSCAGGSTMQLHQPYQEQWLQDLIALRPEACSGDTVLC